MKMLVFISIVVAAMTAGVSLLRSPVDGAMPARLSTAADNTAVDSIWERLQLLTEQLWAGEQPLSSAYSLLAELIADSTNEPWVIDAGQQSSSRMVLSHPGHGEVSVALSLHAPTGTAVFSIDGRLFVDPGHYSGDPLDSMNSVSLRSQFDISATGELGYLSLLLQLNASNLSQHFATLDEDMPSQAGVFLNISQEGLLWDSAPFWLCG